MKIIKRLWIFGAFLYSLFFLLTCFSQFIAPSTFQYISFTALAFPALISVQFFLTLISFFIHRRTAFFCLICLAFSVFNIRTSFSFQQKTPFDSIKQTSSIRILTWNVQSFYRNAYNKPFKHIAEFNADIVCLQDYAHGQIEKNMREAGYVYMLATDQTIALFSKFPIVASETPVSDSSTGEKFAVADIKVNNDTVRVYSVHLQSYALFADTTGEHTRLGNYKIGYERKRYFVKRIRDVAKIHERQVRFIRRHMSLTKHPIIFCGDINSVPTSYTYHELSEGFKDAHLEKGYLLGGTYFHLAPTLRIDLCLVDPRFNVIQTTIDQRKLSDHKALITDLKLNR